MNLDVFLLIKVTGRSISFRFRITLDIKNIHLPAITVLHYFFYNLLEPVVFKVVTFLIVRFILAKELVDQAESILNSTSKKEVRK